MPYGLAWRGVLTDIDRNCHQLTLLICVSHVLDDGRQKQRDGVERGVDSDGNKHVNVNLPVFEGIECIL